MGRSLDEDAPPFASGRADLVDLEGHLGLRVLDPGTQVLSHRAVLPGPEQDRPLVQRVIDRNHGRPEAAGVPDPADTTRRDQPQALLLVQRLKDRTRGLPHLAVACHIALPSRRRPLAS